MHLACKRRFEDYQVHFSTKNLLAEFINVGQMKIASILLAGIIVGAVFPIFIIVQLELPDKLNTPAFWTLFVLFGMGVGSLSGLIIALISDYWMKIPGSWTLFNGVAGVIIGIITAPVAIGFFMFMDLALSNSPFPTEDRYISLILAWLIFTVPGTLLNGTFGATLGGGIGVIWELIHARKKKQAVIYSLCMGLITGVGVFALLCAVFAKYTLVLIFLGGIFGLISGGIIKSEPGYRPVLAVRIILGVIIGIIAATVATVCFLISLWPAGRSGGEGAPVVIGTIVLAIGLWPVLLIPGILLGGFGGVISEQLLWRMTRTIFKMTR